MGKKIIKIVIGIVIASLLFAGGWMLKSQYDQTQEDAVTESASAYVLNITSGRMDAAYESSSEAIKGSKNLDEFKASYGDIVTSNPKIVDTKIVKTSNGYEVYQQVENLPTTPEGRTDGVFMMLVEKESGKWKVAAASVK